MANLEVRTIGNLDCHVITSDLPPQLIVVICHGYGAPGDDLVPVGAQILRTFPQLLDAVQFVFPIAPLSLAAQGLPEGRAWWPLSMASLQDAADDYRSLRQTVPDELSAARDALLSVVDAVQAENGLDRAQIVLGGFSQGAMVTTDLALRLSEKPGGLLIWSGTLINEEEWTQLAPSMADLPIVQSHGKEDPILPHALSRELRDLLRSGGANLRYIEFKGPHTIPPEAIQAAGQLCADTVDISE